ncbi:Zinc finger, PMZ-type [Sesbania bispinosa]|nr:Zinc finger, PMZ-type [Sesbania bispinosa]
MENINDNVGENVVGLEEIESEDDGDNAFHYDSREFVIGVDSEADFVDLNPDLLTEDNMRNFNFPNLDVSYNFYNTWYGKMKGFSARKGKERKNAMEEIIEKTYLCHREGKIPINTNEKMGKKKREAKPETRCLCPAKMKVRLDVHSGRWNVTKFCDAHNHEMLNPKYTGMLPDHRKLSEADILEMNNMRNAGITTPQIYGSFSSQSGGYNNVGFRKRDLYNEIGRQRMLQLSDAKGAIKYLREREQNEGSMFWRHTTDSEGRLQRLFWCDGQCQVDYKLFGDVLAFDATHHETEETYVWVLEQLMVAMKGKMPSAVITDGDLTMRNAIKRVLPNAHHRLCAWHLCRNAASNVKNPKMVSMFRKCMLGDYEVSEFKHRWEVMVKEFRLEENNWVKEMYEKKRMWATTYIGGNFFVGFRKTSRCEGLHGQLGKFVHSRTDLVGFLKNYGRFLEVLRYNELEVDFESVRGDMVLETNLHALERSTSKIFTKEVFILVRPALARGSTMRVMGCTQLMSQTIFTVTKYGRSQKEWQVSYIPEPLFLKCSCQRMESFGLPCDHIIGVMVHLNIQEMPKCLVPSRWTMGVKDSAYEIRDGRNSIWDSVFDARCGYLDFLCKKMNRLGGRSATTFNEIKDWVSSKINLYSEAHMNSGHGNENGTDEGGPTLKDPIRVASKGCAAGSSSQSRRRPHKCRQCGVAGHNRTTFPNKRKYEASIESGECEGEVSHG